MTQAVDLVSHAFKLAATLGRVFPCCYPEDGRCGCGWGHEGKEIAKAPRTPNGHKDATYDLGQISAWWKECPKANIGVALEQVGLLVIGPDSPEWDTRFEEKGLPPTAVAQTGGGEGHFHYYYRRPSNCPIYRNCRPGEYDIMTSGQTIAPPSLHRSGIPYRWLTPPWDVGDLPEAPQWAVDMLREAMTQYSPPSNGGETWEGKPSVNLDDDGMG